MQTYRFMEQKRIQERDSRVCGQLIFDKYADNGGKKVRTMRSTWTIMNLGPNLIPKRKTN